MIVWPTELPGPKEMVVGADSVHELLVGWLELLGHRRGDRLPDSGHPADATVRTA